MLGLAGRCNAASGRRQSHLTRSNRSTTIFEVNASFEFEWNTKRKRFLLNFWHILPVPHVRSYLILCFHFSLGKTWVLLNVLKEQSVWQHSEVLWHYIHWCSCFWSNNYHSSGVPQQSGCALYWRPGECHFDPNALYSRNKSLRSSVVWTLLRNQICISQDGGKEGGQSC